MSNQTTSHILMVRPANFGFNEETAKSNAFQSTTHGLTNEQARQLAVVEFDDFVKNLRAAGVNVIVVEDTPEPVKPDAVFPNNWVTFHHDGTVVTYPMLSVARRLERRHDILENLRGNFRVSRLIAFEDHEEEGEILEGTGSMILDRENKLVYACLSPRTSPGLLAKFCESMGYEAVAFRSVDGDGQEIYHTNVMMALGETFVVICMDTVHNEQERALLAQKFSETKKEIIEITLDQMMQFAGNMLQVKNENGEPILVMSEAAYQSLTEAQISKLESHTKILHQPIPTIEKLGGGSVRCMMAEVFLPEKN